MTDETRAEALMRAALPLMASGAWEEAAASLEQAASLHAAAGRAADEARCLQLAATLRRASGDLAASRALGERAIAAAPGDVPLAVAHLAERATGEAARGEHARAVADFTSALEGARQIGLAADAQIALLRARAASQIALGALAAADADVAAAGQLADSRIRDFLRAEQAKLLLDAGHPVEAARALPPANVPDAQLRAEILVQQARLDAVAGDARKAIADARAARAAAREALAPVPYFAAGVVLAQALDARGDHGGAYATLATTWGTLSDLLGPDVARSWVEPILLALRLVWGDAEFAAVKQRYDARRRAELGRHDR